MPIGERGPLTENNRILNKIVQIARLKILNGQSYHRRRIGRAGSVLFSGDRKMIDDDDKEFRRDMRGLHKLLIIVMLSAVAAVLFAVAVSRFA
jgi:hypothetical protein